MEKIQKQFCILFIIVLSISLYLVGCTSEKPTPDSTLTQNPPESSPVTEVPFHAQIDPPEGWEEHESTSPRALLYYIRSHNTRTAQFFIYADRARVSIDKKIEDLIENHEREYEYVQFAEPQDMTIDDYPGKLIKYSYIDTYGSQRIYTNIFIIIDDWLFTILYQGNQVEDYNLYEEEFFDIIPTIQIRPTS